MSGVAGTPMKSVTLIEVALPLTTELLMMAPLDPTTLMPPPLTVKPSKSVVWTMLTSNVTDGDVEFDVTVTTHVEALRVQFVDSYPP